jgi:hypothetical protein
MVQAMLRLFPWLGRLLRPNNLHEGTKSNLAAGTDMCAQQTRLEEIKIKHNSRDRKAKSWSKDKCMFCGVNQGITKGNAVMSGLCWEEQHRACWACLRDHASVMTKKMALKKFAKNWTVKQKAADPAKTATQHFGF